MSNLDTAYRIEINALSNGSQIRIVDRNGETVDTWSNLEGNYSIAMKKLGKLLRESGELSD